MFIIEYLMGFYYNIINIQSIQYFHRVDLLSKNLADSQGPCIHWYVRCEQTAFVHWHI